MSHLSNRRKARELALKALYMFDVQGEPDVKALQCFWEGQPAKEEVRTRAEKMVRGVLDHVKELDRKIATASKHWRIERMSRVDRNVLRLAAFEILHDPEVPEQVSIDEAVEIARRYGDNKSSAFINGILDHIWKEEKRDAP